MNRKIMVDTSVWIEYFKNNVQIANFIERNLLEDNVSLVGIIISELVQGIKNEKEREIIRINLSAVNYIDMKFEDWINVGELSNKLRKSGLVIPLSDIVIAAAAIKNDLLLVARDKHFKLVPGLTVMEL